MSFSELDRTFALMDYTSWANEQMRRKDRHHFYEVYGGVTELSDSNTTSAVAPAYVIADVRGADKDRIPFMEAMEKHEAVKICFGYTSHYVVARVADGFTNHDVCKVRDQVLAEMGLK